MLTLRILPSIHISGNSFQTLLELSVCLSPHLSVCLSACLSVCLPVCLSVCLSVCLPICLSVCLPVCLSVTLPFCDNFLEECLFDNKFSIVFSSHLNSHSKIKFTFTPMHGVGQIFAERGFEVFKLPPFVSVKEQVSL